MSGTAADQLAARAASPPRYQPLVPAVDAVIAGIVVDRFLPQPAPLWWCVAGVALIGWWCAWRWQRDRTAMTLLMFALAAVGAAWHHGYWYLFADDEVGLVATEEMRPVSVEAIVLSTPQHVPAPPPTPLLAIAKKDRSRLDVQIVALGSGDERQAASGRSAVIVEGDLRDVWAGDRVRIVGQLAAPAPMANPGDFDFAAHARADRLLSVLWVSQPESVTVLERSDGWSPARWFDNLRSSGDTVLWHYVERDQSGMAAALLLGEREQLDEDETQAYFRTGTIHLLSISGLHVGMLAVGLFWVLRTMRVRREKALIGVALIVTLYMLLIHAEPPAVRAAIIVLVVCGTSLVGRQALGFNALAAAALVVLAMNPADLFRAGPQLSFLAAGVLAWFGPRWARHAQQVDPLDRLIASTRPWPWHAAQFAGRWLWRALAVSCLIWIIALPLVAQQFHIVSPVALLLTPILALPVAGGLGAGFCLLLVGWMLPPLGYVCGWLCDHCLRWTTELVQWAERLPGSYWWTPGPRLWWVLGFYAMIGLAVAFPRLLPSWRMRTLIAVVWLAMGWFLAMGRTAHPDQLICTFLSVGHGEAVVLELPDGRVILYDAGRLGSAWGAARSISGFLWWRGISRLDAVVVSHADVDHFNALPELLKRFPVDAIYLTAMTRDSPSPAVAVLRQAIDRSGARVATLAEGETFATFPEGVIRVLHPPANGVGGNDNANSIVLSVEYRGRRILLPGDLEAPGLDRLLRSPKLDSDVVLAPHHGSLRSDPPGTGPPDQHTTDPILSRADCSLASRHERKRIRSAPRQGS